MAPEMTLAIARRESEFDPKVVSGAGARGLMQVMPATAQEVAGQLGRATEHTTARLTADPDYNADLGSAFLAQLAKRFDGNVVLMSAAYNAGAPAARSVGLNSTAIRARVALISTSSTGSNTSHSARPETTSCASPKACRFTARVWAATPCRSRLWMN